MPEELSTEKRTDALVGQLLDVWEASVRATHAFLSDAEVEGIKPYVPTALREVAHLVVARSAAGTPIAFMGIEGRRLEMLFVTPSERGQGLGRRLLAYGVEQFGVDALDVNEQNPQARGFYEHLGFEVAGRSELDGQGNPYPILHMRKR